MVGCASLAHCWFLTAHVVRGPAHKSPLVFTVCRARSAYNCAVRVLVFQARAAWLQDSRASYHASLPLPSTLWVWVLFPGSNSKHEALCCLPLLQILRLWNRQNEPAILLAALLDEARHSGCSTVPRMYPGHQTLWLSLPGEPLCRECLSWPQHFPRAPHVPGHTAPKYQGWIYTRSGWV